MEAQNIRGDKDYMVSPCTSMATPSGWASQACILLLDSCWIHRNAKVYVLMYGDPTKGRPPLRGLEMHSVQARGGLPIQLGLQVVPNPLTLMEEDHLLNTRILIAYMHESWAELQLSN